MSGDTNTTSPAVSKAIDETTDVVIEFCAKIADILGKGIAAMRSPMYRQACEDIARQIRGQIGHVR